MWRYRLRSGTSLCREKCANSLISHISASAELFPHPGQAEGGGLVEIYNLAETSIVSKEHDLASLANWNLYVGNGNQ